MRFLAYLGIYWYHKIEKHVCTVQVNKQKLKSQNVHKIYFNLTVHTGSVSINPSVQHSSSYYYSTPNYDYASSPAAHATMAVIYVAAVSTILAVVVQHSTKQNIKT
jgi:hypothetical protein